MDEIQAQMHERLERLIATHLPIATNPGYHGQYISQQSSFVVLAAINQQRTVLGL